MTLVVSDPTFEGYICSTKFYYFFLASDPETQPGDNKHEMCNAASDADTHLSRTDA